MTLRNGIPWPQLTFVLAKDIIDKNIHTTYLTPAEVHCFETATETLPQWIAFFTSSPHNTDDNSAMDLDVHEHPNQQHQNNYNNALLLTELETSAFRVRSLLFENFIPHLYHSNRPCCQLANLDMETWTDKANALPPPDPLQVKEAIDDLQQKRQQQLKQQQELQSRQAQQPRHDTASDDQPSSDQQKEQQLQQQPPPQEQEQEQQQLQEQQQQPGSTTQENGMDESTTTDKQVPSILSLADPDKIPILDIYYTLETDQPVMIEQQKLKEYEAQEALNEEEEEKENAQDHSLSMFNADGNFTLKYLLKGISANWETMGLSDRELQDLLSDFKPHRSKWANDEKQGQEELYEAMEKVLLELKNYTAHSTPFLNKVSKREAPDYLDVIVRPMDLGTVAKKLKQLEYKTKQEFADDLYLIYDNCLIYNTNPASEYRKHATAMRRKTERLLTRVPNLVIKDKSDGEQEEEGEEASDEDQDEKHHTGKTPGKHKHAMTSVQKNDAVDVDRASRERSLTRGSSAAPGASTESLAGDNDTEDTPDVYDAHKTYGGKQLKNQNGMGVFDSGQEKDLNGDIDAEWGELREQVWYEVTKKTRAERTKDLLEQDLEPFGEHEALVRSAFEMERFAMMENTHNNTKLARKLVRCTEKNLVQWTDRRRPGDASIYDDDVDLDSSDDEILDAFFSRKISKPKHADEDDAARANLFLPDYAITAGIPDIANIPQEYRDPTNRRQLSRKGSTDSNSDLVLDSKGYTDVSLDAYPDAIFPNHGLNNMIDNNIQTLQQIRRMHAKCTAVRNNVSISTLRSSILPEAVDTTQPAQPPTEDMISPLAYPSTLTTAPAPPLSTTPSLSAHPLPETSRHPPPLLMTESSAQDIFQRTTSKLLAHAGFEGANENALRVLTDVATDYITNIGKTLRCYMDDYGKQMTGEEILMHTLYENGVVELFDLETYIHDDVERYGYRLEDVHRRLQTSYQDLLSGPSGPADRDDESLLQDDDTFITGVFGEDLGEDYFGFKDLGLDQEYNMNTLSIPSRLWHGRNDTKAQATSLTNEEPLFKYQPRPPFTPLTSSKQIIGLLQPYFDKKFSETEENRLVEDEFSQTRSSRRPRHPPVHLGLCAPGGGRKKLGKDGYGPGSGDKKGKRKRPTEEIKAEKAERAEKRRLKMEEKKQKVAEKEQKRKLREELKEQERLAKQEAKEKKALAKKSTASSSSSSSKQLGSNSSSPSVYEKEDH